MDNLKRDFLWRELNDCVTPACFQDLDNLESKSVVISPRSLIKNELPLTMLRQSNLIAIIINWDDAAPGMTAFRAVHLMPEFPGMGDPINKKSIGARVSEICQRSACEVIFEFLALLI
jgi:hypothetical protein